MRSHFTNIIGSLPSCCFSFYNYIAPSLVRLTHILKLLRIKVNFRIVVFQCPRGYFKSNYVFILLVVPRIYHKCHRATHLWFVLILVALIVSFNTLMIKPAVRQINIKLTNDGI